MMIGTHRARNLSAWARPPGSGRNDRMCAAQKAGFAVTERKNVNPSWRAAH
jgi:hypothetical protein